MSKSNIAIIPYVEKMTWSAFEEFNSNSIRQEN